MNAEQVRESMARLAGTRPALRARTAGEIAQLLGRAGERFLELDDSRTRQVVQAVALESGLSVAMSRRVVQGMARDWTPDRLSELLHREFPDPAILDGPVPDPRGGRNIQAVGDAVAVHIGSGSVPGVSASSMIRSLLVKTPVLIKPGAGDRALTEAFHRALTEVEPSLAASAVVSYWPRDDAPSLAAALRGAARVVVYGSDAAVGEVRAGVPVIVPVVAYHHRFSVAVLGPGALSPSARSATLAALARAVCTFDQRGCVSPHRVYLMGVDSKEAVEIGGALAHAMQQESEDAAPGALDGSEAAGLQQLRAEVRMRSALDPGVMIWASPDMAWTVILDPDPEGAVSGHPRSVTLTPVPDQGALLERLRPLRGHLQSVGMEGVGEPASLIEEMVEMGASRIAPLSELPFPPAWWIHDGAGPLRALIRYSSSSTSARQKTI